MFYAMLLPVLLVLVALLSTQSSRRSPHYLADRKYAFKPRWQRYV